MTEPVPSPHPTEVEIPVLPVSPSSELHILEDLEKPSRLVSGGYFQFRVNGGSWATIMHGETTYPLNANDVITLFIGSDTQGKIDISPDRISEFSFDDVHLFINENDKGSGTLNRISVNGYDQVESTLVLDTLGSSSWTRFEVNGVPVIPGVTNNSRIRVVNLRPSMGVMKLDNTINTRYDGGAEAYELTAARMAPVSSFIASPTFGQRPLVVRFTDTSINSPSRWEWDFGDSNTTDNNIQNPVHLYQNTGNYTVKLTASNSEGTNTRVRSEYIIVSSVTPPNAGFTGTPVSGPQPLSVRFTDTSLNTPTTWFWDFGDGSTVNNTLQNPLHTYSAPGTFSVNLTASNPGGSSSYVRTNYVTVGGVTPPVVSFTASPSHGAQPLVVQFTDTSANSPITWLWDFGDGNTTGNTLRDPMHKYVAAGTYTVTLTASNAGGSMITTKDKGITVTVPPPAARFTGSPVIGVVPMTVSFTDNSNNTPTSWFWDFGDGGTSTLQNPTHVYIAGGIYTVSLTSANDGGNSSIRRSDYIVVNTVTR